VAEDRWVFPHSGADATDHWFVSERDELSASPAIRLAGGAALELAGAGADEVAFVDLYSCFPSAVQIAAKELGFGLDRQLTVTGGLCFAGGPGNNYVSHSIATMVERLREDPEALGLCTALGWYITKHAFGVYGARPPAAGFRHAHTQDEIDELPRREVVEGYEGPATVDSWMVMFSRDSAPETAVVVARLDDGRRALASTADPLLAAQMVDVELAGRPVKLREGGFDLG
jgi:acetyl-CoA C-acetyltransferase